MKGFGPADLLDCYARGVFPMAEGRDDPRIYLLEPDERGILPLDGFHIPKRLKKTVRRDPFEVVINRDFSGVIDGCSAPAEGREETWINPGIRGLYLALHKAGYAHSVECYDGGYLVGGLYGVSLGSAFFGESMFSRATDASKVALVHLVARLRAGRYTLLDTQFTTTHLEQFGADVITREDYRERLADAIGRTGDFLALPERVSGGQALQSITQTS